MYFLKIMGQDDMPLLFAGENANVNLITVFYDDYGDLLIAANSLVDAGAVVVIGKSE